MKTNSFVFLTLTMLSLLSCSDKSTNSMSFEDTISLMENNPKQFLTKLGTSSSPSHLTDENDATAFLLKSMCKHYIDESVFPPIDTMEHCVSIISHSDDIIKQLESLLFLAQAYHHKNEMEHEIYVINKALTLAKNNDNSRWIFYLYNYLGDIYLNNVDLLKYAEYSNLAKEFYTNADVKGFDVYTKLLMGKAYIYNSKFNEAIDIFKDISQKIGEDHAYYAYNHYLLGVSYFKTRDWESCIHHIKTALPHIHKSHNLFLSYSMLTYCYYSTNNKEEADKYKQLAIEYDTINENSYIEIDFYRMCATSAEKENEIDEKIFYLNKVINLYDKELRSLNDKTLNTALLKYEYDQKRRTYKEKIMYYQYAALLFVLALAGSTWFYIKRRKQQAYRLLLLQEQIEKLQSLTKMNEEMKSMIMRDMEIARRVSYLRYSTNDKGQKLLQEIEKLNLLNGNKLLNTQWKDFFQHIDLVFDGFYTKLCEKYPSLIDKEIQLCCMLIAGFRTEEIAAIWGQSIYTVHKCKTSVRKKIGVPEGIELINFLNKNQV